MRIAMLLGVALALTAGCQSASKVVDETVYDANFVLGGKWTLKEVPAKAGDPESPHNGVQ